MAGRPKALACIAILVGLAGAASTSFHPAIAQGTQPIGEVSLERGWNTFGLALPRGAATDTVRVSDSRAQTDVKTRWPDGSIRFAVVSTQSSRATNATIFPDGKASGGLQTRLPAAEVILQIAGEAWTASLPTATSGDVWLDGPLVREARHVVTPTSRGQGHPFLRVLFDVRSYQGGGHRVDVTVENTLDVPGANRVQYDADIRIGGASRFRATADHPYLTRWRKVFAVDTEVGSPTPAFESFVQANAIPGYRREIENKTRSVDGEKFNILKVGELHVPMDDVAGRPEIAPYPDWTAQFLVHRQANQRAYVLAHGDLAGSYSIHVREADGRLVTIDERPGFWLDARADQGLRNTLRGAGGITGTGYIADTAHQPSLAFVPYLVTGDRYYSDEMMFWANFCLLKTFQDPFYNTRRGAEGLLHGNQVRGFGWALRNIGDAAAFAPDNSPYKAYLTAKISNNLAWLDNYSATTPTPLGVLFTGKRPEDDTQRPYSWIALWEHEHLAWAIDRVNLLGFQGGVSVRDRIVDFQIALFSSEPEYPKGYGAPYLLAVGRKTPQGVEYFSTMGEVFRRTFRDAFPTSEPQFSSYNVQARLALLIGARDNRSGAAAALNWVNEYRSVRDNRGMADELNKRSGWAILDPSRR